MITLSRKLARKPPLSYAVCVNPDVQAMYFGNGVDIVCRVLYKLHPVSEFTVWVLALPVDSEHIP